MATVAGTRINLMGTMATEERPMQSEMQRNEYFTHLIPCPNCALPARMVRGRVAASGPPTLMAECGAGHQWQIECEPKELGAAGGGASPSSIEWVHESAGALQERLPRDLRAELVSARHVDATARGLRVYTEDLAGPLEVLVMSLARELHDAEHSDCDWFGHNGSTVTSFCRRACEQRGLDWAWVYAAIQRERLDENTEHR